MRVTPLRLTTLQCSQIGFTLLRTFTVALQSNVRFSAKTRTLTDLGTARKRPTPQGRARPGLHATRPPSGLRAVAAQPIGGRSYAPAPPGRPAESVRPADGAGAGASAVPIPCRAPSTIRPCPGPARYVVRK